jgi:hypothetical protein
MAVSSLGDIRFQNDLQRTGNNQKTENFGGGKRRAAGADTIFLLWENKATI